MELYLGGLNGNHLQNLLLEAERVIDGERRTEEVWAAVAYATDSRGSSALISHCFEKSVPLKFWGRLDDQVAVDVATLNLFLQQSSPDYVCKLVPKHHAKVIWWRSFGVYIGSANLTYSAWNKNIEAGCFFEEEELTTDQIEDLEQMFEKLDERASPLTEELRNLMIARGKKIAASQASDPAFWKHPSITDWGGLITREPKLSSDNRRDNFLLEWNETCNTCAILPPALRNRNIVRIGSMKVRRPVHRLTNFCTLTTTTTHSMVSKLHMSVTSTKTKDAKRPL